ncbi:MAG: nitroreductase family protein [Hyphomicrobiaceae bacterium]|nr:nitroreductase family protein [Hyphomicrobiaceae bacterium]
MPDHDKTTLDLLVHRFGDDARETLSGMQGGERLATMAARRSHRRFLPERIPLATLEGLAAVALCAPSKSDMQARDIVIVKDETQRRKIDALLVEQTWVAGAPELLVFCGNNHRQRLIHDWRDKPFANDHLDAFFNAAVDAGILLSAFVIAAEAIGLGCCAISAIRNHSSEVSDILGLPDHVFPVAGLGVGRPSAEGHISLRLPLDVTVHVDRYGEENLKTAINDYDARRAQVQPFRSQREVEKFGESALYGWSEDKARQYSKPERADFGAFVRAKGFKLD